MADERKPLNRLRTLLREKKPAFGAIATMPSLQAVQVMANSGLDWVIVDLEHGAIDLADSACDDRRHRRHALRAPGAHR